MKTASQIIGHITMGVTADLYMHVENSNLKQTVEQIGNENLGEKVSEYLGHD